MSLTVVPTGNSQVARSVDFAIQKKDQHFLRSAALSKQPVYNDLVAVWTECKTKNWDGYNALPVKEQTFINAYFFINALPIDDFLPSVGVEPDGHLTLEWYRNPRWTLSVSISPEGNLYYAALFGDSVKQGTEVFSGQVSQTILDLIGQVRISR